MQRAWQACACACACVCPNSNDADRLSCVVCVCVCVLAVQIGGAACKRVKVCAASLRCVWVLYWTVCVLRACWHLSARGVIFGWRQAGQQLSHKRTTKKKAKQKRRRAGWAEDGREGSVGLSNKQEAERRERNGKHQAAAAAATDTSLTPSQPAFIKVAACEALHSHCAIHSDWRLSNCTVQYITSTVARERARNREARCLRTRAETLFIKTTTTTTTLSASGQDNKPARGGRSFPLCRVVHSTRRDTVCP